jgi:hypothetical protein
MRTKLIAAATMLAACSPRVDEVDLTGVYRVDEAVGSAPCDVDLPVNAPAFVKFERVDDVFEYSGCTDAGGTSCSSLGLVVTFDEPTNRGWRNRDTYVSSSEGNCFMGYFEMVATLEDPGLVFERTIYEEMRVPAAECNHIEAQARGAMMPCVDHAVWSMTAQ